MQGLGLNRADSRMRLLACCTLKDVGDMRGPLQSVCLPSPRLGWQVTRQLCNQKHRGRANNVEIYARDQAISDSARTPQPRL